MTLELYITKGAIICMVFTIVTGVKPVTPECKLYELSCGNDRCVDLNQYCDGSDDCGDSSDEPRHCTPCNRTYYGKSGTTYQLELHRPKEDRLPYVCMLTFIAAGGEFGDLIQLTFTSFTLGRFMSFITNGCPDGALQISELGRPQVGGVWCGTLWGPAHYYSETRSITTTIRLQHLSKDSNGYNFDFKLEYKTMRKSAAVTRYGASVSELLGLNSSLLPYPKQPPHLMENPEVPTQQYYLGELIPGTYCSRIFSDCDRKICRLQSPNFPGVYPRNLTCYYAVRQHEVPAGQHALISIRQPRGQLIAIRSSSTLHGARTSPEPEHVSEGSSARRGLRVWEECDDVQDYVTVYDGYTTRDPAILRFCGGGEAIPEAVSSGPELLVEFTSSPYGTFLLPTHHQMLHGFQLEVDVRFVEQQSPTYASNKRSCEFWLRGTGRGVFETPKHSLSPNTTCLYHLQGLDTSAVSGSSRLAPRFPENFSWRLGSAPL